MSDKSVIKDKRFNPGPYIVIILLVAVIAAGVIYIYWDHNGFTTRVDGGITFHTIRDIAELSTLEYAYTESIIITDEAEFKLLGLWDIHPGEKILLARYDGLIKLGIDFSEIKFNDYPPANGEKGRLEIQMPKVKLISSEIVNDSFEVVFQKNIFTTKQITVEEYMDVQNERKKVRDSEIMKSDMPARAMENAKVQVRAILESTSQIRDNYDIIWTN